MKRYMYGSVTVIAFVALWQLAAVIVDSPHLLPGPAPASAALSRIVSAGDTYRVLSMTLFRLAVAVSLAGVLGTASGVLAGESEKASALLQPIVLSLRTIPVASVIVIVLILIGRDLAVYPITFLMLYPIFHEGAKQGILSIDAQLLGAAALEKVSYSRKLFKIKLPLSAPFVKTAWLQSIGLGFKVLVMAEFVAQVDNSIGRSLHIASLRVEYADVFAWTVIIIAIVFAIDVSVNALTGKKRNPLGVQRKNLFKHQRKQHISLEK